MKTGRNANTSKTFKLWSNSVYYIKFNSRAGSPNSPSRSENVILIVVNKLRVHFVAVIVLRVCTTVKLSRVVKYL